MIDLKFKVDPIQLANETCVSDPVKVKVCDLQALHSKGILGDSGMKMAEAGFSFYFEKELAKQNMQQSMWRDQAVLTLI